MKIPPEVQTQHDSVSPFDTLLLNVIGWVDVFPQGRADVRQQVPVEAVCA